MYMPDGAQLADVHADVIGLEVLPGVGCGSR